eukprot:TRINITY_DN7423_c0_g2_i1.p1 TRINITY_DN7423_c0_g2~~TRINITY_DN7423_c0_g2_i1.p1  ORF type:complete len:1918 (+),score=538.59 TRINITY_DN7423_c0_g2_i1:90-5756(+)
MGLLASRSAGDPPPPGAAAKAARQWRCHAAGQRRRRALAPAAPASAAAAEGAGTATAGAWSPEPDPAEMLKEWQRCGARYSAVREVGKQEPPPGGAGGQRAAEIPARLEVCVFLPEARSIDDICLVSTSDRVLVMTAEGRSEPSRKLAEVELPYSVADEGVSARFSAARSLLTVDAPVSARRSGLLLAPAPLSEAELAAAAAAREALLSAAAAVGSRPQPHSPWFRRGQMLGSAALRNNADLQRWREVSMGMREDFSAAATHLAKQAIITFDGHEEAPAGSGLQPLTLPCAAAAGGARACLRELDGLVCVWVTRGSGHRGLRAVLRECAIAHAAVRVDPADPLPLHVTPCSLVSYCGRVCLVMARPPCRELRPLPGGAFVGEAAYRQALQELLLLEQPPRVECAAGSDGRVYLLPGADCAGVGTLRTELVASLERPLSSGASAEARVARRLRAQADLLVRDEAARPGRLPELLTWLEPHGGHSPRRRASQSALVRVLHAYGLNARHLGAVAQKAAPGGALCSACHAELLARATRDVWAAQYAEASPQESLAAVGHLVDAAVGGAGDLKQRDNALWLTHIAPGARQRLGGAEPPLLEGPDLQQLRLRCWQLCGVASGGSVAGSSPGKQPTRFVAVELAAAIPACDEAATAIAEGGGRAVAARLALRGAARCRTLRRGVPLQYRCVALRKAASAAALAGGAACEAERAALCRELSLARRATPPGPAFQAAGDPLRGAKELAAAAAAAVPLSGGEPFNHLAAAAVLTAAAQGAAALPAGGQCSGPGAAQLLSDAALAHTRKAAGLLQGSERRAPLELLCAAATAAAQGASDTLTGAASPETCAAAAPALAACEAAAQSAAAALDSEADWAARGGARPAPREALADDDVLGPVIEDAARAAAELGEQLLDAGAPADGERALRASVALYRLSMPQGRRASDPGTALSALDVATAMNNLGFAVHAQGPPRGDEALALFREAMNAYELLPRDQAAVEFASALNNFASVLYSRTSPRDMDEAGEIYAKALQLLRDTLPEDHPDIVMTVSNVGVLEKKKARMVASATAIQREWRRTRAAGLPLKGRPARSDCRRGHAAAAREIRREEAAARGELRERAAAGAAQAGAAAAQSEAATRIQSLQRGRQGRRSSAAAKDAELLRRASEDQLAEQQEAEEAAKQKAREEAAARELAERARAERAAVEGSEETSREELTATQQRSVAGIAESAQAELAPILERQRLARDALRGVEREEQEGRQRTAREELQLRASTEGGARVAAARAAAADEKVRSERARQLDRSRGELLAQEYVERGVTGSEEAEARHDLACTAAAGRLRGIGDGEAAARSAVAADHAQEHGALRELATAALAEVQVRTQQRWKVERIEAEEDKERRARRQEQDGARKELHALEPALRARSADREQQRLRRDSATERSVAEQEEVAERTRREREEQSDRADAERARDASAAEAAQALARRLRDAGRAAAAAAALVPACAAWAALQEEAAAADRARRAAEEQEAQRLAADEAAVERARQRLGDWGETPHPQPASERQPAPAGPAPPPALAPAAAPAPAPTPPEAPPEAPPADEAEEVEDHDAQQKRLAEGTGHVAAEESMARQLITAEHATTRPSRNASRLCTLQREEALSRRGLHDWHDCEMFEWVRSTAALNGQHASQRRRRNSELCTMADERTERQGIRAAESAAYLALSEEEAHRRAAVPLREARIAMQRRQYMRRRPGPSALLAEAERSETRERQSEQQQEEAVRRSLQWAAWSGGAQLDVAQGRYTARLHPKQRLAGVRLPPSAMRPPPAAPLAVPNDCMFRALAWKHRALLEALDRAAQLGPGSPPLSLGPAATEHPTVTPVRFAPAPHLQATTAPGGLPPVRPPPLRSADPGKH